MKFLVIGWCEVSKRQSNFSQQESDDDILIVSSSTQGNLNSTWFDNLWDSQQMEKKFGFLEEVNSVRIFFVDDSSYEIKGTSLIQTKGHVGKNFLENIVFVSQRNKNGYKVGFYLDMYTIKIINDELKNMATTYQNDGIHNFF